MATEQNQKAQDLGLEQADEQAVNAQTEAEQTDLSVEDL